MLQINNVIYLHIITEWLMTGDKINLYKSYRNKSYFIPNKNAAYQRFHQSVLNK